jgi:hypothetical protein
MILTSGTSAVCMCVCPPHPISVEKHSKAAAGISVGRSDGRGRNSSNDTRARDMTNNFGVRAVQKQTERVNTGTQLDRQAGSSSNEGGLVVLLPSLMYHSSSSVVHRTVFFIHRHRMFQKYIYNREGRGAPTK